MYYIAVVFEVLFDKVVMRKSLFRVNSATVLELFTLYRSFTVSSERCAVSVL